MSWLSDAFSSVGSTIARGASAAWDGIKAVAANTVVWLADKAEQFIGDVKETWKKVKPYLQALSPYLEKVAVAVAKVHPWLGAAVKAIDVGLQGLFALENSPILKNIEQGLHWAIKVARHLKSTYLTTKEIEEAAEREKIFEEATQHLSGTGRDAIRIAGMINNYVKTRSVIKLAFESSPPQDFNHYLRLRASQKLLEWIENIFDSAQTLEEIGHDNIFLLDVAGKLIKKNPTLLDEETKRLDDLVQKRSGKNLISFVFEELVAAWQLDLKTDQAAWVNLNGVVAKDTVALRNLEVAKSLGTLSALDQQAIQVLQTNLLESKRKLGQLEKNNREMQNYVYAAEGFLEVLEKSAEELEAEGKDYLREFGSQVGMIIIDCAENGKKWEALTEDEQSLVNDFAIIFEEASQKRLERVLRVEVGA